MRVAGNHGRFIFNNLVINPDALIRFAAENQLLNTEAADPNDITRSIPCSEIDIPGDTIFDCIEGNSLGGMQTIDILRCMLNVFQDSDMGFEARLRALEYALRDKNLSTIECNPLLISGFAPTPDDTPGNKFAHPGASIQMFPGSRRTNESTDKMLLSYGEHQLLPKNTEGAESLVLDFPSTELGEIIHLSGFNGDDSTTVFSTPGNIISSEDNTTSPEDILRSLRAFELTFELSLPIHPTDDEYEAIHLSMEKGDTHTVNLDNLDLYCSTGCFNKTESIPFVSADGSYGGSSDRRTTLRNYNGITLSSANPRSPVLTLIDDITEERSIWVRFLNKRSSTGRRKDIVPINFVIAPK